MPRFEQTSRETWLRARGLRRNLTEPERRLWRALRGRQLGVRFLNQHAIGPYIADFFAYQARLVVEVDGLSHAGDDAIERDRQRDAYFASQGYIVRHYSNQDVMANLDGVVKDLRQTIEALCCGL